LPHSVDANRSERVRISISFNAMFAAFAETMATHYGAHRESHANPIGQRLRSELWAQIHRRDPRAFPYAPKRGNLADAAGRSRHTRHVVIASGGS
jgi:hypothetical protein